MEQQLINYVEQESKRGVPEYMVKKALREAGWSEQSIEEAFAYVQSRVMPPSPDAKIKTEEGQVASPAETEELAEEKGSKKPLVIAAVIFGVLIAVAGSLVAYFKFLSPSEEAATDQTEILQKETVVPEVATTSVGALAGEPESPTTTDSIIPGPVPPMSATSSAPAATSTDAALSDRQARDSQRMQDMQQLVMAQESWRSSKGKYYTCGLRGGDCQGKPNGYPDQIGTALAKTPQDPKYNPAKRALCGTDYVYCGLNNSNYADFFCYYAKLENGGYYTASHAGNFKRSTAPKIFEDCAAAN